MKRRRSSSSRSRSAAATNIGGGEKEMDFWTFVDSNVSALSNSKVFVGLVIICFNTVSKFVSVKFSTATENYLKTSFAWQILIFCMSFMATRDIWVALFLTFMFVVVTQYICNEESMFCLLPQDFKERYMNLDTKSSSTATNPSFFGGAAGGPTSDEIERALQTLKRLAAVTTSGSSTSFAQ